MLSGLYSHAVRYPSPRRLPLAWAIGSAIVALFVLQITTGVLLSLFYDSNAEHAFSSVVFIIQDLNYGYALKYLHLNIASAIFFMIYLHMFRSMYFMTYLNLPTVWYSGIILLLLTITTAFLGYVLPWGQMSFWAATVITNLVTTVPYFGDGIIILIHGGFSVGAVTLNRFFILHFLFAILLVIVIAAHINTLHTYGSSTRYHCVKTDEDKVPFFYFYIYKDIQIAVGIFIVLLIISLSYPNILNHPDNFIEANPMVTPAHIVPEWYFLPFHAIPRSVPSKLGGVVVMFVSILLMFIIPIADMPKLSKRRYINHKPFRRFFFRFWFCFLLLGYLGAMPAASPYVKASKTVVYFYYYVFIRLLLSKVTLTMFDRLILFHWQEDLWLYYFKFKD